MIVDNKFEIGETVYLKTDKEQLPRLVYRFLVYKSDILYGLTQGTGTSEHYDFEISTEKNILIDA